MKIEKESPMGIVVSSRMHGERGAYDEARWLFGDNDRMIVRGKGKVESGNGNST